MNTTATTVGSPRATATETVRIGLADPTRQPARVVEELTGREAIVSEGLTDEGHPSWKVSWGANPRVCRLYSMDPGTRLITEHANPIHGGDSAWFTLPGSGIPTAHQFGQVWRNRCFGDVPAFTNASNAAAYRAAQETLRFGPDVVDFVSERAVW